MTRAREPTISAPRAARPWELDAVRHLLGAAGLPRAGVEEHFTSFHVLEAADGRVAALAGTERYGRAWLLRSLVVAREFRGRGHGSVLVGSVLAEAGRPALPRCSCSRRMRRPSSPRAKLLAAGSRVALRSSAELQGACPATATLMRSEVAP